MYDLKTYFGNRIITKYWWANSKDDILLWEPIEEGFINVLHISKELHLRSCVMWYDDARYDMHSYSLFMTLTKGLYEERSDISNQKNYEAQ